MQPISPEGNLWSSGVTQKDGELGPKTSRKQENVSTISQCFGTKDLPGGEIDFKYMAAHLQIGKLYELGGERVNLKTTEGKKS